MQNQVSAERIHIGFFGMRNAGKSSIVNQITGQKMSIVSDVPGTTTDPVRKSMELLPLGPVVIIDTPGLDDEGELGQKRMETTKSILHSVDIAVLVVDGCIGFSEGDLELLNLFTEKKIPHLLIWNKKDLWNAGTVVPTGALLASHLSGEGIFEIKESLGRLLENLQEKRPLVSDLVQKGDIVFLVVPIDKAAPKGRLILPQQMVLRELLDAGAIPVVCRESELAEALNKVGKKPTLVITDSQVFKQVNELVPEDIPLTGFSVLMARYKGLLEEAVKGAAALSALQEDDCILIAEGCTHHRQCGDIGTEKLPNWIRAFSGKSLRFSFVSGREFPEDVTPYKVVVQCGGCMLNEKEMQYRMAHCKTQQVPMTNYGITIARTSGILKRALSPFSKDLQELLQ